MKEWELARNIQKIHAAIHGPTQKRGGRVCVQWLFYMDVNLILCLVILNPESKLLSKSNKKRKVFCLLKKLEKKEKQLVTFPFCLSLWQHLDSHCPVAALVWHCNTRSFSAVFVFFSPSSQDVLRAKFSSSGSRGAGHSVPSHWILSAELCRNVPLHGWMQWLLQRQSCSESKQTTFFATF